LDGTVKRWMGDRGYGFIAPAEGGNDIFVHAVALVGITELHEGQRVTFDTETDQRRGGKLRASNVQSA